MNRRKTDRRAFLKSTGAAALGARGAAGRSRLPNFIFIFADDLGYGDLGSYGSKIRTPQMDRMAQEGVRFTNFYSANPVCSPSRAGLLTGRYPPRTGIPRVLFPKDKIGMPDSETTIAQMLKPLGYATMCIGKWHLGSLPEFLPTNRGFDHFYGLPYSNDMSPLPLMSGLQVIEQPVDQSTLTQRYTAQATAFINANRSNPFFLYMPHTFPHIPLAASKAFLKRSPLGLYGDVVEEIDWSVGKVLQAVKDAGMDDSTMVLFSSDNGPWFEGSPGRLRGRKASTYEGGVREPLIARFPGHIPRGFVAQGVASALDILPTFARLAGAKLPPKALDGVDIWPLLSGAQDEVDRDVLLYFDDWNIQCARLGRWKLHVARYNTPPYSPDPPGGRMNLPLPKPELYDLNADPEESWNAAADFPEVVSQIRARVEALLPGMPAEVQSAWNNTVNIAVESTPSGALPVKKGS